MHFNKSMSIPRWIIINTILLMILGPVAYWIAWELAATPDLKIVLFSLFIFLTVSFVIYLGREVLVAFRAKSYARQISDIFGKYGKTVVIPDQTELLLPAIIFNIEQLILDAEQLSISLAQREHEFWSILDTQTEFVFIVGEDGYVSYKNRAFDQFFRNPIARLFDNGPDVFSRNISELMSLLTPHINRAMETNTVQECMTELPFESETRYISWKIKQQAEIIPHQFLLVGRDETDGIVARKENERLEKIATVGRAASTIFHEVNQPMSVIQLSSTLIQDSCSFSDNSTLDKEGIDEIFHNSEIIVQQISRINQIIKNLRLFYSGSSSKVETENFNPDVIISSSIDNLRHELDKHHIRLNYSPDTHHKSIHGNQVLFSQVIQNILQNSIHSLSSMPGEHIKTIDFELSATNNLVVIRISDNGKGIPKEIIDKVMEPFFTTKPINIGSGLGLALCLSVIKNMNGELLLNNNQDNGLTTTIKIPISPDKT